FIDTVGLLVDIAVSGVVFLGNKRDLVGVVAVFDVELLVDFVVVFFVFVDVGVVGWVFLLGFGGHYG
ncbi:hypothetical protein, partial [Pseudomonas aeruginosa]